MQIMQDIVGSQILIVQTLVSCDWLSMDNEKDF